MKTRSVLALLLLCPALGVGLAHLARTRLTPAPAAACPHGIPPARCPFCDPGLDQRLGPCHEHGVPEARCTRCHRELIPAFQAAGDWCGEHDLPESQCAICDPSRAGAGPAPAAPELSLAPGEPAPREGPAPRPGCQTGATPVVLRGPEVARALGIETAPAARRALVASLSVPARVEQAPGSEAALAARLGGTVSELLVGPGAAVASGQVLLSLEAPELADAGGALLAARALSAARLAQREQVAGLMARGISTRVELFQAEALLAEARCEEDRAGHRLRSLGLGELELAALQPGGAAPRRLELRAPFAGQVLEVHAAPGEVAAAGAPLVRLADPARLVAVVEVPEADQGLVSAGQELVLDLAGLPGEPARARLTWVAPRVDPAARTVEARAALEGGAPPGLRAGQRGRARVVLRGGAPALLVPRDAVHWEGCCHLVFVARDALTYEPRKVQLGVAGGGQVEVLSGLAEGEAVVVQGSFQLLSEVLAASIGAGCCAEEGQ